MKRRLTTAFLFLFVACLLYVLAKGASAQEVRRLSLPDRNWGLDISLAGFTILNEQISTDGRNYALHAAIRRRPDGRIDDFSSLEIQMGPAESQGNGNGARKFAVEKLENTKGAQKGRVLSGKIRTFEYNGIPISRYDSKSDLAPNIRLRMPQQNLEAYFVKNGVWIVITFSTSSIDNYEEKLFSAVLDSVHVVDTPANLTNSSDFYQRGRALFLQTRYAMAIESYTAALRLEQNEQRLGIAVWRRLIEDLTESYAMIGEVARSIETLGYGISKDPTFPMFHMGLARLYASQGDLDNTIASLERAFAYKENYKESNGLVRRLPDPLFDKSFARFKKDEKFRKAVKAMTK